jgi:hypothetical protein
MYDGLLVRRFGLRRGLAGGCGRLLATWLTAREASGPLRTTDWKSVVQNDKPRRVNRDVIL